MDLHVIPLVIRLKKDGMENPEGKGQPYVTNLFRIIFGLLEPPKNGKSENKRDRQKDQDRDEHSALVRRRVHATGTGRNDPRGEKDR